MNICEWVPLEIWGTQKWWIVLERTYPTVNFFILFLTSYNFTFQKWFNISNTLFVNWSEDVWKQVSLNLRQLRIIVEYERTYVLYRLALRGLTSDYDEHKGHRQDEDPHARPAPLPALLSGLAVPLPVLVPALLPVLPHTLTLNNHNCHLSLSLTRVSRAAWTRLRAVVA